MPIRKALITAANPRQRTLPLQTLMDQNGEPKSALQIVLEEAAGAGIEEFCVVVCPGDETAYAEACGALALGPGVRCGSVDQRAPGRPTNAPMYLLTRTNCVGVGTSPRRRRRPWAEP
jgi:hypothetical protein